MEKTLLYCFADDQVILLAKDEERKLNKQYKIYDLTINTEK